MSVDRTPVSPASRGRWPDDDQPVVAGTKRFRTIAQPKSLEGRRADSNKRSKTAHSFSPTSPSSSRELRVIGASAVTAITPSRNALQSPPDLIPSYSDSSVRSNGFNVNLLRSNSMSSPETRLDRDSQLDTDVEKVFQKLLGTRRELMRKLAQADNFYALTKSRYDTAVAELTKGREQSVHFPSYVTSLQHDKDLAEGQMDKARQKLHSVEARCEDTEISLSSMLPGLIRTCVSIVNRDADPEVTQKLVSAASELSKNLESSMGGYATNSSRAITSSSGSCSHPTRDDTDIIIRGSNGCIDGIESRIQILEETLSDQADTYNQRLEQLQQQMEVDIKERVQQALHPPDKPKSVDILLGQNEKSTQAIMSGITKFIEVRVKEMESRLTGMVTDKFKTILEDGSRAQPRDSSLDLLKGELKADFTKSIDRLQHDLVSLRDSHKQVSPEISALRKQHEAVVATLHELDSLKAGQAVTSSALQRLGGSLQSFRDEATQTRQMLDQKVGDISQRLTVLSQASENSDLPCRVDEVKAQLAEIQEFVQLAQTKLDAVDGLQSAVNAISPATPAPQPLALSSDMQDKFELMVHRKTDEVRQENKERLDSMKESLLELRRHIDSVSVVTRESIDRVARTTSAAPGSTHSQSVSPDIPSAPLPPGANQLPHPPTVPSQTGSSNLQMVQTAAMTPQFVPGQLVQSPSPVIPGPVVSTALMQPPSVQPGNRPNTPMNNAQLSNFVLSTQTEIHKLKIQIDQLQKEAIAARHTAALAMNLENRMNNLTTEDLYHRIYQTILQEMSRNPQSIHADIEDLRTNLGRLYKSFHSFVADHHNRPNSDAQVSDGAIKTDRSSTPAAVASLIGKLRADLDELKSKPEPPLPMPVVTEEDIKAIDSKIVTMNGRLDSVSRDLVSVQRLTDASQQALETTKVAMQSYSTKYRTLTSTTDELASQVRTLRTTVDQLQQQAVTKGSDTVGTEPDSGAVAALESKLTQTNEILSGQVENLNVCLSRLRQFEQACSVSFRDIHRGLDMHMGTHQVLASIVCKHVGLPPFDWDSEWDKYQAVEEGEVSFDEPALGLNQDSKALKVSDPVLDPDASEPVALVDSSRDPRIRGQRRRVVDVDSDGDADPEPDTNSHRDRKSSIADQDSRSVRSLPPRPNFAASQPKQSRPNPPDQERGKNRPIPPQTRKLMRVFDQDDSDSDEVQRDSFRPRRAR